MKTKTKSIITPATSMLFDFQTSLIKGRNQNERSLKFQMGNASFNKTSHSECKYKKMLPIAVINTLLYNKRSQISSNTNCNRENNDNNKIDVTIGVNYPLKGDDGLETQEPLENDIVNQRSRQRNTDSYYQNNLNISLTNYIHQSPHQDKEEVIINPLLYQFTEPQDNNIVITDGNNTNGNCNNGGIECSKASHERKNNVNYNNDNEELMDSNEGLEFDSKKNTDNTYFSTGNINDYILTNSGNDIGKRSSSDNISCIAIQNRLIEGLNNLDRIIKKRDKEKIDYLNKKFELYKNALVQLGSQGVTDELVRLITDGMNSLIIYYNENKEKMNMNYSDLFHKYVEIQKDNQDKAKKLLQLALQIEEMKNNGNNNQIKGQTRNQCLNQSNSYSYTHTHTQPNSRSHTSTSNKNKQLILNRDNSNIKSKQYKKSINPYKSHSIINNATNTQPNFTEHTINKAGTYIKKRNHTKAFIPSSPTKELKINDIDSQYLSNSNNPSSNTPMANNIKFLYTNNGQIQNTFLKSNVPRLDLNINAWKNNSHSKKQQKQLASYSNAAKPDHNSNENILSLSNVTSLENTNLFLNQCNSFLRISRVNKMRKSAFK